MPVTRQTKHVIIVLSKIATKRRGNEMAFSRSKVVKNFGSKLPMTENELCAIIVPSKTTAKTTWCNGITLAQVVENIGTPLPYTDIGICAIIVSCKTG